MVAQVAGTMVATVQGYRYAYTFSHREKEELYMLADEVDVGSLMYQA